MSHTEDSEMHEPHDPDQADSREKTTMYLEREGGSALFIRAIEITNTVGGISRKVRYEFEGGHPVEIWATGSLDDPFYLVPAEDSLGGY